MTGSSSTEDGGAVVAPLTFGAAMASEKMDEVTQKQLYVGRTNRLSAQSATSKSAKKVGITMHLGSEALRLSPMFVGRTFSRMPRCQDAKTQRRQDAKSAKNAKIHGGPCALCCRVNASVARWAPVHWFRALCPTRSHSTPSGTSLMHCWASHVLVLVLHYGHAIALKPSI